MSIFKIEDAKREGARLVIGLGGVSGGGKTFTALQLAWGMSKFDSSKVGLVCTENKRGRLYADCLKDEGGKVHRFKVLDLTAPFSPERYVAAIEAFVEAGVEVVVIDSVSHEWEGLGGCEDIANSGGKIARWDKAKAEHKRFMNTLLSSPVHVIACMRAREKVKLVKREGKTDYEPMGIMPIQEKNFVFELTASLLMFDEGRTQQVLKCPSDIRDFLGRTAGYITAKDGEEIRRWVDGDMTVDLSAQAARDTLQMNAEKGSEFLKQAWKDLPAKTKKAISPKPPHACPDDLKASAAAFDKLKSSERATQEEADALNSELLGDQSENG